MILRGITHNLRANAYIPAGHTCGIYVFEGLFITLGLNKYNEQSNQSCT